MGSKGWQCACHVRRGKKTALRATLNRKITKQQQHSGRKREAAGLGAVNRPESHHFFVVSLHLYFSRENKKGVEKEVGERLKERAKEDKQGV